MNKVELSGKLVRDANFREIKEGMYLSQFTLLVESKQGSKDNPRIEKLYASCKAWNKLAQQYGDSLKEGAEVSVTGRLKYEQWDDKEGNKKTAWVVICSDIQLSTVADKFHPFPDPNVTKEKMDDRSWDFPPNDLPF